MLVIDRADKSQAIKAAPDYRADLDGLRGVAVAAVLAYHLDLPVATGGFVGVDVFFVLSGFLITRIIANELQAGTFTIGRFYERRIRRIVPALVFVCALTTMAAVAFLLPDELQRYASSLIAAAFSVSNIWFLKHSAYFDANSGSQPLLHTWSLGIEEQFYIVFPLLLIAVYRWWPRALAKVVWFGFATSLAASILLLPEHPLGTFFLLHSRAWELLAGSIVALGLLPRPASRMQSEAAAGIGGAAIALSIFTYSSKTLFPGIAAVLPSIGTAAVIWAGESRREHGVAFATRLLATRPLVLLGLISYSLYLWHWPLIVFTKLETLERLDGTQQLALVFAAVSLASATWYFVERPFRRWGPEGFTRRSTFSGGAFGLGTLAATAAILIGFDGMPQRFPTAVLQIAAAQADASPLRDKCHFDEHIHTFSETCVIGDDVPPSVIVYGDSHGAELSAVLGELAKQRHASIRQITSSGCPPAAGFSYDRRNVCAAYNDQMIKQLVSLPPTTIVIATYSLAWTRRLPSLFWPGIGRTIAALRGAGHRVLVLGPVPDFPSPSGVPAAIARWAALGHDPNEFSFEPHQKELHTVEARLETIATARGAIFIPISPELCSESRCKAYANGEVLYFDNNHLSMSGAQLIASRLLVPVIWPESNISGLGHSATN